MERKGKIFIIPGFLLLATSCTYHMNEVFIPSQETTVLEARRVTDPPMKISSSYWSTADYLVIHEKDIKIGQVSAGDGLLNVNGMYNGVGDFNGGQPSLLTLKAAYDDENLYILATWKDRTFNDRGANWLYDGPSDPRKTQDSSGWTSQGSDDNLILVYPNGGNNKDIWKWSLALSEPMGYAIDMYDNGGGWSPDAGNPVFVRNAMGSDFRSGPKYEWNGEAQTVMRILGGSATLDPGYFLLNKTDFTENLVNGRKLYLGNCSFCHGTIGEGHAPYDTLAPSLREPAKYNRIAFDAISSVLSQDSAHAGAKYWNGLSDQDRKDVYAGVRAFSGFPGYYLANPDGSSSDVLSLSSVTVGRININASNPGYKVLLVRKLVTGNSDDIQFNLSAGRQYEFDVYLSDDDVLNLVGETSKVLVFK